MYFIRVNGSKEEEEEEEREEREREEEQEEEEEEREGDYLLVVLKMIYLRLRIYLVMRKKELKNYIKMRCLFNEGMKCCKFISHVIVT